MLLMSNLSLTLFESLQPRYRAGEEVTKQTVHEEILVHKAAASTNDDRFSGI